MLDKMTLEQLRERRFLNSVRGIKSSPELIAEIERREALGPEYPDGRDETYNPNDGVPTPRMIRQLRQEGW